MRCDCESFEGPAVLPSSQEPTLLAGTVTFLKALPGLRNPSFSRLCLVLGTEAACILSRERAQHQRGAVVAVIGDPRGCCDPAEPML